MFTTVLPRSAGTRLIGRPSTSFISREASSTRVISSAVKSSRSRTWRRSSWDMGDLLDRDLVDSIYLGESHAHLLAARGGHVLADIVGADRQLTVPAVDERGK